MVGQFSPSVEMKPGRAAGEIVAMTSCRSQAGYTQRRTCTFPARPAVCSTDEESRRAFIPQPDDGFARGVVVTKEAQRSGIQIETSPLERRELEPPRGHHPRHIAVPKEQYVPNAAAQSVDHPVGTRSDINGGFAVRAAVFEQTPRRVIHMNLGRSSSLVGAVVPLDQIGI